jgi:phenylpropionate dioxygenase-like ring-hydroxylating dioxygenase large terminal subunit
MDERAEEPRSLCLCQARAMDRETQLALLDRIQAHRAAGRGTDEASDMYQQPVDAYTSADRLAAEQRLMVEQPTVVGLSGLLPGPNTFAEVTLGTAPIVITRDSQGQVHALLNVCRHRGAQVAHGCGTAALLTCPYHGWTYHFDGSLSARRRPSYFEETADDGLVSLPVLEQHGLIWVAATPGAVLPSDPLHGAAADISELDLANHRLFTSSTFTRPFNWKLVIDTFLEVYHVGVLHKTTIDPLIHSDYALFDAFGPHGRMVVTRKSIDEIDSQPRSDWEFFPHSTIVWALQPNAILIYQQDHAQLYQARPGAHPGESIITVSVYVPRDTKWSDDHWQKNFDLLVEVTDTEDFVTCAGIQRGFESGAQEHITFGTNEPLLAHYERELTNLLGD